MTIKQPIPKMLKSRQKLGTWPRPAGASDKCYAVRLNGTCLEPFIKHDSLVCVEPTIPALNELAVFFFKDGREPLLKQSRTRINQWVFPMHPGSEVVSLLRLRQWNPMRTFQVPANQIEAIHTTKWYWVNDNWRSLDELCQYAQILDYPERDTANKEKRAA